MGEALNAASRRRVVHAVRSTGFAGVERYVCDVATELSGRNWDVVVVGGDPRAMLGRLPEEVRYVEAASTLQVARRLVECRTDVVHSHMTAADVAAALQCRRGAVRVSTRHFAAPRGGSPLARRLVTGLVEPRLDVTVAISHFVKCRADSTDLVLHNGVPSSSGSVPWDKRERQVLVLQRLQPEKDTLTALQAWSASSLPVEGWRLVIAGSGDESVGLQRRTKELRMTSSVDFVGFQDAARALLAGSRALIATAPSEPFGLAVVEAMAEGTPVIAAGAGAHLETVGPEGWFFAPGDSGACAALLDRLRFDGDAAAAYGSALRARQQDTLSLESHVDALERVYEGLLSGPA